MVSELSWSRRARVWGKRTGGGLEIMPLSGIRTGVRLFDAPSSHPAGWYAWPTTSGWEAYAGVVMGENLVSQDVIRHPSSSNLRSGLGLVRPVSCFSMLIIIYVLYISVSVIARVYLVLDVGIEVIGDRQLKLQGCRSTLSIAPRQAIGRVVF